jgi:hypothetical protein
LRCLDGWIGEEEIRDMAGRDEGKTSVYYLAYLSPLYYSSQPSFCTSEALWPSNELTARYRTFKERWPIAPRLTVQH